LISGFVYESRVNFFFEFRIVWINVHEYGGVRGFLPKQNLIRSFYGWPENILIIANFSLRKYPNNGQKRKYPDVFKADLFCSLKSAFFLVFLPFVLCWATKCRWNATCSRLCFDPDGFVQDSRLHVSRLYNPY
jgi:hypothetical protein